jgi:hypothetical protein
LAALLLNSGACGVIWHGCLVVLQEAGTVAVDAATGNLRVTLVREWQPMCARGSSDFFVVRQNNRSTNTSPALGILWLLPYTPGRALFNPHSHEQGRIPIFLTSL